MPAEQADCKSDEKKAAVLRLLLTAAAGKKKQGSGRIEIGPA